MSSNYPTARAAVAAEAAGWVIQIDDGALDSNTRRVFLDWLRSSPQHIDEFLLAAATWRELDELDVERQLDVGDLIAQARQSVVAFGAERESGTSVHDKKINTATRLNWRQWTAAAAVFVVIGTGLVMHSLNPSPEFVTDVGHQMTFTLKDGSVVHLNTRSALDTRITESEREITLLRGEAMFEVAKDPARPFRVRSGSVIVEAVGTRFNVYQREDTTTVTVEEGRVSVTTNEDDRTAFDLPAQRLDGVNEQHVAVLVLKAGEEARAFSDGDLVKIEKPDFEKSTAWRERRLVFRSDSLETVAEEFNRYNRHRINIQVQPKDSRNITGTFDADDPESFVAFLEKDASLDVIRYEDRIVVRPLRTVER